jgi:hypothetical protein
MLQCMTDWLVSSSRRYTEVSKTTRSLHDIPTKVQSVSNKWSPYSLLTPVQLQSNSVSGLNFRVRDAVRLNDKLVI